MNVQQVMAASRARALGVALAGMLAAAALTGAPAARAAGSQRYFTTPEEGVSDLVAALRAHDQKALLAILGPDGRPLVDSGDAVADRAAAERFVQSYDEAHSVVKSDDGRKASLDTGTNAWPFPIPLAKDTKGWRFDTHAGKEEILSRRIGRNELAAIEVCRAYVDAQREYYGRNPQGDPLLQYAQKVASAPGKHDGLYWETRDGEEASPLGPLIASARGEGYSRAGSGRRPAPYHGYYYKILTAQGAHAPGGDYSYLAHGKMIGGFALVAYPAEWDNSGIMTFMVNQDGVVFQKDLGPKTAVLARAMTKYDPDDTWIAVDGAAAAK